MKSESVLVKLEKGSKTDIILFFPEESVNHGKLSYWSPLDGSSEADIDYYRACKNPPKETEAEIAVLLRQYESCYHTELRRVYRLSYAARKRSGSTY